MVAKYILITNLDFVSIRDVCLHCAALVLQHDGLPARWRTQLRGFGYDPSWPVFEMGAPGMAYSIVPAVNAWAYTMPNGPKEAPKPLSGGGTIKIEGDDRPELELHYTLSDPDFALDVIAIEGTLDDHPIRNVWTELAERVERYYMPPAIPTLVHRLSRRELARREALTAAGIAASNPPVQPRRR